MSIYILFLLCLVGLRNAQNVLKRFQHPRFISSWKRGKYRKLRKQKGTEHDACGVLETYEKRCWGKQKATHAEC